MRMPPGGGGGGLRLETPPWCPPGPHARGHECGEFARTQLVVCPPAPSVSGRHTTRCCYSTGPSWAGSSSGGKARPSCWGTGLALPRPIYDPGCQPWYEGLIPNSRTAKAASVATNVANPGPNGPQRPAREPPLRPLPQRLTSEMPWGQYKQQAPMLRLRYGARLFCLIFRSPALISRD